MASGQGSGSGIKAGKAFVMIEAIDKTSAVLNKITGKLNGWSDMFASMASKLSSPFQQFVGDSLTKIDELAKTSDRIGILTSDLTGLRYAAEQTGAGSRIMDAGLQRMTHRIGLAAMNVEELRMKLQSMGASERDIQKALEGSNELTKVLNRMGLDAKALNDAGPAEAFYQISDGLRQLSSRGEQVAAVTSIFEDEALVLLNTLDLGREGLAELANEGSRLGGTISRDQAADVERATTAITRFQTSITGIKTAITIAVAPALEKLNDLLASITVGIRETVERNAGAIASWTALGMVGVATIATLIGISIAMKVAALATSLAALAVKGLGASFALLTSPAVIVAAAIAGVGFALYKFSKEFRSIADGIGSHVATVFKDMAGTVGKTMKGVFSLLSEGDFSGAFSLLTDGLKLTWLQAVDGMKTAWEAFSTFFVETWSGAAGSVKKLWLETQQSIANSILDLAAQDGILGDMLDVVLGVDVSAERKRAIELERRRLEALTKAGMEATPQDDAFTQSRNQMNAEFSAAIANVENETGQALNDRQRAINEAQRLRKAEIEERQKALDALIENNKEEEAEARRPNVLTPDQIAMLEEFARGDDLSPASNPEVLTGLEKGTTEAAKTALTNSMRTDPIAKKEVELLEGTKGELSEINRKLRDGIPVLGLEGVS